MPGSARCLEVGLGGGSPGSARPCDVVGSTRHSREGSTRGATGELMVRAARLGSHAERRKIAAGLIALLDLAAFQQRDRRVHMVRHELVLEHQESLRALAERLGQPEPVDVAVVAQLELLLTDPASPVYRRGSDPHRLAEVTSRCLESVA